MKNDIFAYIKKFFNTHLIDEINVSDKTIENYKYTFRLLFKFINENCSFKVQNFDFDKFNKDFVLDFLCWLENKRNNTISSRNLRLISIKSFVSFVLLYEIDNQELVNILKIPRKKEINKKTSILSEEEIKLLLEQPNTKLKKGRRKLAILTLLYDAGLRIDELLSLKIHDLNFSNIKTIIVQHGKGDKRREIPISDDTAKILSIYIKDYSLTNDDYLFSNCNKEKLCSNAIRKIIKENVELAKKENPNFSDKVNPHKFRHSKATHLINKGVSVVEVKEFLGHVDLSSTQIYITTDLLKKREALKTIEQQLEINNNNSIVGTNEWLDNLIQDSIM